MSDSIVRWHRPPVPDHASMSGKEIIAAAQAELDRMAEEREQAKKLSVKAKRKPLRGNAVDQLMEAATRLENRSDGITVYIGSQRFRVRWVNGERVADQPSRKPKKQP